MAEGSSGKDVEEATERIARLDLNTEEENVRKESASSQADDECTTERKVLFNKLVLNGKELARKGLLEEALRQFLEAYKIHNSAKLLKRINKLKEVIKEYEEAEDDEKEEEAEEDDDGMVDIGNGFRLATEISQALYPYQKEGLLWFWGLFKKKQGGILGDDMGLGKTIQVISFLAGLFDSGLIKSVLIVMPVSLMENWSAEFKKWAPGIRVRPFHGSNKKERQRNLDKIQHKNGVCLTTYGLVVSSHETLSETSTGRKFEWDYIILDEGHKIKNPTKTSKNVRAIPAKNHFILTGTPIQNNLREMWSLFDFTCQGNLLGSARTFKQEYENPITRARERDASAYEKRVGGEMAESLRKLIEPHFLRRTKAMVLKSKDDANVQSDKSVEKEGNTSVDGNMTVPKTPSARLPESLMRKNDLIVWLKMSETQLKIYVDFLGLERVKEMLMSTRSPLAELNVLKKICDHPRLLSAMACTQLGLDEGARAVNIDDDEDKENQGTIENNLLSGCGPSDATLIQESGKMVFLLALLDNLKEEGHRCLIFSQSRKMLDIIQRVITHRGHNLLRIDGTITSTAERQHLINTFQKNSSYTCFLLTTQVGGVGITLTAADRVVIFDPSWNPATDAQAVDRAYRIGQKKCVVIYRLITCGSIEEKIYRKQIFKDALMKQATGCSKNPFRYFSKQELRDLFTLDDPNMSKTQQQLEQLHAKHRKSDEILDKHIEFLHSLDHVFGITDHDLMYSKEAVETPEELAESGPADAIQARVLRAQNMVAAESSAGGVHNPFHSQPAAYENPRNTLHSRPQKSGPSQEQIDDMMQKFNRKSAIQSKLQNHFEVFQPSRTDNKRFMPGNYVKKPPAMPPKQDDVIDLCTPPVTPDVPQASRVDTEESVIDLTVHEGNENLERSFAGLALDEGGDEYEGSERSDPQISESFSGSPAVDASPKTPPRHHNQENSKDPSQEKSFDAGLHDSSFSNDMKTPIANSTFLPTFDVNFGVAELDNSLTRQATPPTEILEPSTNEQEIGRFEDVGASDSKKENISRDSTGVNQELSVDIPVFDDRMFQTVDLANSPARTPRRSLKHKRRSISQMPFDDINDSDDDIDSSGDSKKHGNSENSLRDSENSLPEVSTTSELNSSEDAIRGLKKGGDLSLDSEKSVPDVSVSREVSSSENPRLKIQSHHNESFSDISDYEDALPFTPDQTDVSTSLKSTHPLDESNKFEHLSLKGYAHANDIEGDKEGIYRKPGRRVQRLDTSVEIRDDGVEDRHSDGRVHESDNLEENHGSVDISDEEEFERVSRKSRRRVKQIDSDDDDDESVIAPSDGSSRDLSRTRGDVSMSDDRMSQANETNSSSTSSRASNILVQQEKLGERPLVETSGIMETDEETDYDNESVSYLGVNGSMPDSPGERSAVNTPDVLEMEARYANECMGSENKRETGNREDGPAVNTPDLEIRQYANECIGSENRSDTIDGKNTPQYDLNTGGGSYLETPTSPQILHQPIHETIATLGNEASGSSGSESVHSSPSGSLSEDQEEELSESGEESPSDAEDLGSGDTGDTGSEEEEIQPLKNKSYQTKRVQRIDSSESDSDKEEGLDEHSPSGVPKNEEPAQGLINNTPSHGSGGMTKKYVCPTGTHQSNVVKIQKCACILSPEEKEEYSRYMRTGSLYEYQGSITKALEQYAEALELDESDLQLQKKVLQLKLQLPKFDQ